MEVLYHQKSCLVGDKYGSEFALKIDTVKDRAVRGEGGGVPEPKETPWLRPCCMDMKLLNCPDKQQRLQMVSQPQICKININEDNQQNK